VIMSNNKMKHNTRINIDELGDIQSKIIDLLPEGIDAISMEDANYHGNVSEKWVEMNQLKSLHVSEYHKRVLNEAINVVNENSVVLELGGGVGYDANLFNSMFSGCKMYILSDISFKTVTEARRLSKQDNVKFCLLEASDIKIKDNQVDLILIIGAFHHFQDYDKACSEMSRVAKKGAYIVLGLEPNIVWYKTINLLKPIYRLFFSKRDHSEADEHMHGFSLKDFEEMATKANYEIKKIIPSWFFVGFLHYGNEFIYRLFRLKKRLKIPKTIARLFIFLDDIFFMLPFTKYLGCNYTVIYKIN